MHLEDRHLGSGGTVPLPVLNPAHFPAESGRCSRPFVTSRVTLKETAIASTYIH